MLQRRFQQKHLATEYVLQEISAAIVSTNMSSIFIQHNSNSLKENPPVKKSNCKCNFIDLQKN